jgi:hypothetical protein
LEIKKESRKINASLENIYNIDEKGFMVGQALQVKVICRRGQRNPHHSHNRHRQLFTVVECISVAGMVIPPMCINKGAKHILGWNAGVQDKEQATFTWSSKGWTANTLGLDWVEKNFEKFTDQI